MNTAYRCDTYRYTNFDGVQLRILENQLIPFYIVRGPLFEKIITM
jgi:hypothetical protein